MPPRRRQTLCPNCSKPSWNQRLTGLCDRCVVAKRLCLGCQELKLIQHQIPPRCSSCTRKAVTAPFFMRLESDFRPLSEYNRMLFQLYIKCIRSLKDPYQHQHRAKRFKAWLETHHVERLGSWSQIREYSEAFRKEQEFKSYRCCPFRRVGYMLAGLGALPQNYDEISRHIELQLERFPENIRPIISRYRDVLQKSRRASRTIQASLYFLADLQLWASQHYRADLLTLNSVMFEAYLSNFKMERKPCMRRFFTLQYGVRRFYEWCRIEKLVLNNPCPKPKESRRQPRATICTEEQTRKILRRVRSRESDPEDALVVMLTLFFGLTKEDLRNATLREQGDQITVVLRRRPLTRGKRYYNRPEQLPLPESPEWIRALQKRFLVVWQRRFRSTLNPMGIPMLILPKRSNFVRPCNQHRIHLMVTRFTKEATGVRIPHQILRQTCGHIYSTQSDASVLSSLGWSRLSASFFAWKPRVYYTGSCGTRAST
jgi:hypothetical protein